MANNEQWFIDRIGKRVFRPATSCDCPTCKDVLANGLLIQDEGHAFYLFMCSMEGKINYQDEPLKPIQNEKTYIKLDNKESPVIHDITDFELQQIIYGLKYRQKAHVRKTPTHEEIHISRMIHFFENLNNEQ